MTPTWINGKGVWLLTRSMQLEWYNLELGIAGPSGRVARHFGSHSMLCMTPYRFRPIQYSEKNHDQTMNAAEGLLVDCQGRDSNGSNFSLLGEYLGTSVVSLRADPNRHRGRHIRGSLSIMTTPKLLGLALRTRLRRQLDFPGRILQPTPSLLWLLPWNSCHVQGMWSGFGRRSPPHPPHSDSMGS